MRRRIGMKWVRKSRRPERQKRERKKRRSESVKREQECADVVLKCSEYSFKE